METDSNKVSKKGAKKMRHPQLRNCGKEVLVCGSLMRAMLDDTMSVGDSWFEEKPSKPEQTFDKMEVDAKETSSAVSFMYLKLLTEDLTSEAGPSKNYWEVISERRRKALVKALEEHQRLQAAAIALEEENLSLAVLFDNTTHLVNTLKEMINEKESDDDHEASNEQEGSGLSTPDSYSSEKHIHMKMNTSADDISNID